MTDRPTERAAPAALCLLALLVPPVALCAAERYEGIAYARGIVHAAAERLASRCEP
jgi:hypothetical protein